MPKEDNTVTSYDFSCEQCYKTESVDSEDVVPEGWIFVSEGGELDEGDGGYSPRRVNIDSGDTFCGPAHFLEYYGFKIKQEEVKTKGRAKKAGK